MVEAINLVIKRTLVFGVSASRFDEVLWYDGIVVGDEELNRPSCVERRIEARQF